ncbi:MAG: cadherin repeat domain-containing protein [Aquabacterium sp.]
MDEFDVGAISDGDATANAVAENAANGAIVGITAHAADTDGTTNAITYSLTDDAGGRFGIDAATGVITVADGSLLDAEAATSHQITVRALSADGSFSTATHTVLITDINDNSPAFTMGSTNLSVDEGHTAVTTLSASDADQGASLSYSIIGGNDAARFSVDSITGQLRFVTAPDHATPTDADGDNRYDVIVQVSDGTLSATASLQVQVQAVTQPIYVPTTPLPDTTTGTPAPADEASPKPSDNTSKDSETQPTAPASTPPAPAAEPSEPEADPLLGTLLPTGDGPRPGTLPTGSALLTSAFTLPSFGQQANAFMSERELTLQILLPQQEEQMRLAALGIPATGLSSPERLLFARSSEDDAAGNGLIGHLPAATRVSGLALSFGTIWWATRAGGLLGSMMISAPAWRSLDPLPVLFNRDEDHGERTGTDDDPGDDPNEEALAEQMFDPSSEHPFEPTPIG